ncbi:MAG: serine protease [Candidatus Methylomirabilis sp.]
MAWPGNDSRLLQISAPAQPGNSGGPLLDEAGRVIGMIVSKLDALKVAEITRSPATSPRM